MPWMEEVHMTWTGMISLERNVCMNFAFGESVSISFEKCEVLKEEHKDGD